MKAFLVTNMDKTYISIKNEFSDLHKWKDAPDEVMFLKNEHRHLFKVETTIAVTHDDRELEFFMVQKTIDEIIQEHIITMPVTKSCEMMAQEIIKRLIIKYGDRSIQCSVSEDGENGAIVVHH